VVVLPTPPLPEVITITRVMIYLSHMILIFNRFHSSRNLTLTNSLSIALVMKNTLLQIIFLTNKN